jgi:hypothetical protein
MTMQMRPRVGTSVGEIPYAPARDIVYLYPDVIRTVAERLEQQPVKELHDWLDSQKVTLDDLGEAMKAFSLFMNAAHQEPDKTLWQVLTECGWDNCKWQARTAVMFYTGILLSGTFFKGIRDVTVLGGNTIPQVTALLDAGKQLDAYISMPRWRRGLFRRIKWLRRLLFRARGISSEI